MHLIIDIQLALYGVDLFGINCTGSNSYDRAGNYAFIRAFGHFDIISGNEAKTTFWGIDLQKTVAVLMDCDFAAFGKPSANIIVQAAACPYQDILGCDLALGWIDYTYRFINSRPTTL